LSEQKFFSKFTRNGDNVAKENFSKSLISEAKFNETDANKLFKMLLTNQNASMGASEKQPEVLNKKFFL
jgi:hypothetical protein